MNDGQVARTTQDLIGRFTPTPLHAEVSALRRTIRLETNSSAILRLMRCLLEDDGASAPRRTTSAPAVFRWRLVSDPAVAPKSPWTPASIVSDEGLRYASFGQSSFVAVDLASRQAVGFVAEPLTRDEAAFKESVLSALFSMTADALGVAVFRGIAARRDGKALLIVGTRPSSNRDFVNLGEGSGFEGLEDEWTFLEPTPGGLQVWAGFRPARVAALAGCVLVESESAAAPLLDAVPAAKHAERLRPYLLFADDRKLAAQHDNVLHALARLPAYNLVGGVSSNEAARLFRRLLEGQPVGKVSA